MVRQLLQKQVEDIHANDEFVLPSGVTRLKTSAEIAGAREARIRRASGKSPVKSNTEEEKIAAAMSKVISPLAHLNDSVMDRFLEFQMFQSLVDNRKRDREVDTEARSSSSNTSTFIDLEAIVKCTACDFELPLLPKYCPDCGKKTNL